MVRHFQNRRRQVRLAQHPGHALLFQVTGQQRADATSTHLDHDRVVIRRRLSAWHQPAGRIEDTKFKPDPFSYQGPGLRHDARHLFVDQQGFYASRGHRDIGHPVRQDRLYPEPLQDGHGSAEMVLIRMCQHQEIQCPDPLGFEKWEHPRSAGLLRASIDEDGVPCWRAQDDGIAMTHIQDGELEPMRGQRTVRDADPYPTGAGCEPTDEDSPERPTVPTRHERPDQNRIVTGQPPGGRASDKPARSRNRLAPSHGANKKVEQHVQRQPSHPEHARDHSRECEHTGADNDEDAD